MSKKNPKFYYLIFIVLAIISAGVVGYGSNRIVKEEKAIRNLRLERANRVAASELKQSLNTYATLLTGIKSYLEIKDSIPTKNDLKKFLSYQLKDLEMDPPFSLTLVDTNHIITYDLVFSELESPSLKGKAMRSIIGSTGVKTMGEVMRQEEFHASNPTNLLEGEVGLPLGFGILDKNLNSKGYLTSVALFEPIVERVYQIIDKETFALSFKSDNGNYFDRTRSHNKQKKYALHEDPEYFMNFDINPEEYVYSTVSFYNKEFAIGTAYKSPYRYNAWMFVSSLLWYLAILGFMLFLLTRFYIYKRKNNTIAAQKRQLTELVATKNKFFNIIAHDLRSPLSSVANFLDILRTEGTDGKTNKKIIEALSDSSKNSLTLLDNLLKWSKVQTGNIKYAPQDINLVKIATDQIRVQQHVAAAKKVKINLECSFNGVVQGDKNLIANVIRNLLSNAIKYSYEGDVITVEISKQGHQVSVSVEDNGVGIPQEYLHKLFDVTQVTTQKGTNNEKGSGLGLVLSKQFIEMHGGTLEIESHPTKGTVVSFSLPVSA